MVWPAFNGSQKLKLIERLTAEVINPAGPVKRVSHHPLGHVWFITIVTLIRVNTV